MSDFLHTVCQRQHGQSAAAKGESSYRKTSHIRASAQSKLWSRCAWSLPLRFLALTHLVGSVHACSRPLSVPVL